MHLLQRCQVASKSVEISLSARQTHLPQALMMHRAAEDNTATTQQQK